MVSEASLPILERAVHPSRLRKHQHKRVAKARTGTMAVQSGSEVSVHAACEDGQVRSGLPPAHFKVSVVAPPGTGVLSRVCMGYDAPTW